MLKMYLMMIKVWL